MTDLTKSPEAPKAHLFDAGSRQKSEMDLPARTSRRSRSTSCTGPSSPSWMPSVATRPRRRGAATSGGSVASCIDQKGTGRARAGDIKRHTRRRRTWGGREAEVGHGAASASTARRRGRRLRGAIGEGRRRRVVRARLAGVRPALDEGGGRCSRGWNLPARSS